MSATKNFLDFELPELTSSETLNGLYESCFRKKVAIDFPQFVEGISYWNSDRYNLQYSNRFQQLDQNDQAQVLSILTQKNLTLAYFIEKMGTVFGPRMMDFGDSVQEKSLYALFTAEECEHLFGFRQVLGHMPIYHADFHPMLPLLNNVIRDGEKMTLVHIVQVLLEGFGLSFYGGLRDSCQNAALKSIYDQVLADETRHHGSGLIVSHQRDLTAIEKEQIFEYSRSFIQSLQKADWVLQAMEQVGGEMTSGEKVLFQQQTKQTETHNNRRARLKQMLVKADRSGELVERLVREEVI